MDIENTQYEWETCVNCGMSEKDYFQETGFALLLWHTENGVLCEHCYGNISVE
jgi:hypothetical protein